MRAASFKRANNPVPMGPDGPRPRETALRGRAFSPAGGDGVVQRALLVAVEIFFEGGSMVTQYSPEEAAAAGEQARESGVWLNCHAQNPASIKLAVRSGFRSIYHCSYADAEAIDLLEEAKDSIFLSPAVGIMWATSRGRVVRHRPRGEYMVSSGRWRRAACQDADGTVSLCWCPARRTSGTARTT